VVGAIWEIVAWSGAFPPRLFPSLETVAATLWRLTVEGILPHHAAETLARLAAGFAIAAFAGIAIGIAMGRSRRAEDLLLPLVSIGAPMPGLAFAPLFRNNKKKVSDTIYAFYTSKGYKMSPDTFARAVETIEVAPQFPADVKGYMQEQAQVLLREKKIKEMPDWAKALRPEFMQKARS